MKSLRARLSKVGIKRRFLNEVALPSWWDDDIAKTPGGFREAAAYIASRLNFSLESLLNPEASLVRSAQTPVKFKKSRNKTEADVASATNCAIGLARAVASHFADKDPADPIPDALKWRKQLLEESGKSWICFEQMVNAAWAVGVPIIHLRQLPREAKKPDALATMVGNRPVIVVMSGKTKPAWLSFIVAHELGHLHHNHIEAGETLVDSNIAAESRDLEEKEANEFASLLLTGRRDLKLEAPVRLNQRRLATATLQYGKTHRVNPGVAALNYGYNSGDWGVANGAVSILEADEDAGDCLRKVMNAHLQAVDFSEDNWEWIERTTSAVE